jgi:hypothetical protein
MLTGTIMQGAGRAAGGMASKAAMDSDATRYNTAAGQAIASGIQGAESARLRSAYIASNARGMTAASGLTTTGTSAVANVGRIRGMGEYQALTSIYEGEEQANDDRYRAARMRAAGSAAQTGGWLSGISTIFSGGTSWYNKYGNGNADALNAAAGAS